MSKRRRNGREKRQKGKHRKRRRSWHHTRAEDARWRHACRIFGEK